MDSLTITGSISLGGLALGVSSDPDISTPFPLSLVAALSSTGTDGTKANQILWFPNRTLATNETFDLTSFTNALKETAASISKVRIYAVIHDDGSAATSITVGNAASPFAGPLDTAATTRTYKPGSGFIELAPTTTGWAVSAGQGVKITANGGTATYSILVAGEA